MFFFLGGFLVGDFEPKKKVFHVSFRYSLDWRFKLNLPRVRFRELVFFDM